MSNKMLHWVPRVLRLVLTGNSRPIIFRRQEVKWPAAPSSINLYIHLPFCRQICPFCPYVKELYNPSTCSAYKEALIRELDSYRRLWGNMKIGSVYIGGGTPSLTPEVVQEVLTWIDRNFTLGNEIGVEVHPLEINRSILDSFRNSGVTMASLGVQSFNDRLLKLLGRNYSGRLARDASEFLLGAGLTTVDIDLMFAIPTQTLDEVKNDIRCACELGADQVSTYPLIPLSYTPLGQQLRQKKVTLPDWRTERRMLKALVEGASHAGYQRTAIWSFNKPGAARYTSVTKEQFIGIGVGAASRIGDYFKVNTFSVKEYIRAVRDGSPVALVTELNLADQMAYWLFWRCYDLTIDRNIPRTIWGRDLPGYYKGYLSMLKVLGLIREKENTIHLTQRGAYIFHIIEKIYTRTYLDTLWAACIQEAWPEKVTL